MNQEITSDMEKTDYSPCPNCGENMTFDLERQTFICHNCYYEADIQGEDKKMEEHNIIDDSIVNEDNVNKDNDNNSLVNENNDEADPLKIEEVYNLLAFWKAENKIILCKNCNAQIIMNKNIVVKFCSFCGSPHIVVKIDETFGITPTSFIPFKISKEEASKNFSDWIAAKFWAPKSLKKKSPANKITGMFIPFIVFDSKTESSYTAEIGINYEETKPEWVTENGQRKQIPKKVKSIRWTSTDGNYLHTFNSIAVNNSKNINDILLNKFKPYDISELIPYDHEYMSEFLIEKCDSDLNENLQKSKENLENEIKNSIKDSIKADQIKTLDINTSYEDSEYTHVLLPIWIYTFVFKNKMYQCFINGQAGKIYGKYPISNIKILITALLIICFVTLAVIIF